MNTLTQWAQKNPKWSLLELVAVINELLPQFLPLDQPNTKIRTAITPRLVRHYTSAGLVEQPQKAGKYAVYTYRHLLQLLLVRRLLAEGMNTNIIGNLAQQKTNAELENWLTGNVELELSSSPPSSNPALDYLKTLRESPPESSPTESVPHQQSPKMGAPMPQSNKTHWTRWEVLPGLELHIRSDFKFPTTLYQQQQLVTKIQNFIQSLSQQSTNNE